MAPASTRIVIVRHGESVAQDEGFLSGHDTCRGLSDLGRRQATALRDRLVASGGLRDAVVVQTSIMQRAIETADIIAPGIGDGTSVATQRSCELCELHPGDVEGLTWTEILEQHPDLDGLDDPFRRTLPGAETWAEMVTRVGLKFAELAEEYAGERIVVVAHGGVVGSSFVALGDAPIRQVPHFTRAATNTSLTEWVRTGGGWRLVRFNDAQHLDR